MKKGKSAVNDMGEKSGLLFTRQYDILLESSMILGGDDVLYAVSYSETFSAKKEEAAYQHLLGRKLLFWAMKQEYGADPALLSIERGEHGKPYFGNHLAKFSVSHCQGYVCCALSEHEIGVDAEVLREYDPRIARRICTEEELDFLENCPRQDEAFTILWTLKESRMKLSGEGTHFGFQKAAFLWNGDKFTAAEKSVSAVTFEPFPKVFLSVCTRDELPQDVNIIDISRLS